MTGRITGHALLLALALGLAACGGTPLLGSSDFVLTKTQVKPAYDVGNFRFAHGSKNMPVAVSGRARGLDEQAIGVAIAQAMTGRTPVAPTTFVSAPDTPLDASRLAVRVAPPIDMSAGSLCAGRRIDQQAQDMDGKVREPDRLTLLLAYCNGARHLSSTHLTLALPADGTGFDTPAFRRAAALVATEIFPARDPNDDASFEFMMAN
ncbi:hypothetical protein KAJ83_01975 [Marivibrio halodurans]|uniref:Lipoprotein n=1 Tax=Marivibrio halodurans TaxID=2039722 RepID=A0A8J7RWM7_9PROT|nr:hypothetical protein [Marivibrio halodurans]MBP5855760.1 hypothetical protein [Marivibrio halodurans]